jgi:NAD(P)-dependent dehydrogenase (short-subunit alcohol dehydrogenase family)
VKLRGASAIVSGGASGLGLATVRELARRRSHPVVIDLPSQGAAQRVAEAGGVLVEGDVTDEDAVRRAVTIATEHHALRLAVCCAGVVTPARVLKKGVASSLEGFERVVRVNLVGTFNVVRLVAEAMATNDPTEGDAGVVVLTASVAAYDGMVGQAAYSASKAGVAGMVLPLARDLADVKIRVMAIAPGTFATPMLASLPESTLASLAAAIPHPSRVGDPAEFAALVGHILDNGMLNGEVIRLDGAIRMAAR